MSVNKFKSTSVYGAFANKNRLDQSGNLVESCSATFEGQILYDDMSGNTINANTINYNDISGNTINANTINANNIYFDDISGNTINANTINSNNIHFDDLSGNTINANTINANNIYFDDISGNTINANTFNVSNFNADNINFIDLSGNTIYTEVIHCKDLIAVERIDANELNTTFINVNDYMACGTIFFDSPQTTCTGSTSGAIVCSQPFIGNTYKKVVIYLDELIGNATYTFPHVFTNVPISNNIGLVSALSATSVTITTVASTTKFIILEGF